MEQNSKINSENLYYKLMGPYMYEFCVRLYAFIESLNKNGTVRVYFCARAGFSLKYLFELFLIKNKLIVNVELILLPVSRLSLLKALISESPLYAGQHALSLFPGTNIKQLITQLHKGREDVDVQNYIELIPENILTMKTSPWALKEWINFDRDNIKGKLSFIEYSSEQRFLIQKYFIGDIATHVVVDSGLYASSVEMLSALESNKNIFGAMVYLSNYRKSKPAPHLGNCIGIMGESDRVDFQKPHSSVLLHWHLIENLLEPNNVNSIKALPATFNLDNIEFNENTLQVIKYFNGLVEYNIKAILIRLMKTLAMPSKKNIEQLFTGGVCNDINDGRMSIVISPELEKRIRERDKLRRSKYGIIKRSLWKPAQVVSSYGMLGSLFNFLSWHYNRYLIK